MNSRLFAVMVLVAVFGSGCGQEDEDLVLEVSPLERTAYPGTIARFGIVAYLQYEDGILYAYTSGPQGQRSGWPYWFDPTSRVPETETVTRGLNIRVPPDAAAGTYYVQVVLDRRVNRGLDTSVRLVVREPAASLPGEEQPPPAGLPPAPVAEPFTLHVGGATNYSPQSRFSPSAFNYQVRPVGGIAGLVDVSVTGVPDGVDVNVSWYSQFTGILGTAGKPSGMGRMGASGVVVAADGYTQITFEPAEAISLGGGTGSSIPNQFTITIRVTSGSFTRSHEVTVNYAAP